MWIGPSSSLPVALRFVGDQGKLVFALLCISCVFRVVFGHGNKCSSVERKAVECCSSNFRRIVSADFLGEVIRDT